MRWIDFKDILLVLLIFVPLERLLPQRPKQRVFRRAWQTDVAYFFANGFLIPLGLVVVIVIAALVTERFVPAAFRSAVAAQPLWLQLPAILILADLGFYFIHRAFHAVPALWRFHAVHHSIEELDWLAAHRVHPVDQIMTKGVSILPLLVLGFSSEAMLIFSVIYHWQSLLLHSNVRIAFGPLRWIIASPRFHHWHHANQPEAIDKNFAGQLAVLDLVFGTMHFPRAGFPERYGTDAPVPNAYLGQLAYPFRKPAPAPSDAQSIEA